MKQVKVIFWLIGFGCGMAVAGIIGTLLTLNMDWEAGSYPESRSMEKIEEQEKSLIKQGSEEAIELQAGQDLEEEQKVEEALEGIDQAEETDETIEGQKTEGEKIFLEIYIPEESNASDICTLLQEAGIIEDGKAFLSYIRAYQKQTKLKHGYVSLPYNSSYSALLERLLA